VVAISKMSRTGWKCNWLTSWFPSGMCFEYSACLLWSECLYFIIYGFISFPPRSIRVEH